MVFPAPLGCSDMEKLGVVISIYSPILFCPLLPPHDFHLQQPINVALNLLDIIRMFNSFFPLHNFQLLCQRLKLPCILPKFFSTPFRESYLIGIKIDSHILKRSVLNLTTLQARDTTSPHSSSRPQLASYLKDFCLPCTPCYVSE